MKDRIDLDDDGQLDDLVILNGDMIRIERMTDKHLWMAIYREGKNDIVIHAGVDDNGNLQILYEEQ